MERTWPNKVMVFLISLWLSCSGIWALLLSFPPHPPAPGGSMEGVRGAGRVRAWATGKGWTGDHAFILLPFEEFQLMYSVERAFCLSWDNYYSRETLQCGQITLAFSSSRRSSNLTSSVTPSWLHVCPTQTLAPLARTRADRNAPCWCLLCCPPFLLFLLSLLSYLWTR